MEVQVAEPLRCHQRPAVLSVRARVVRSFTTKHWATQSLCTTPPANSNSELLTVPCGFVQLTRDSTMSFGKGMLHTMGCAPAGLGEGRAALGCGGNFRGVAVGPGSPTPPHMYPEASLYPSKFGRSGTSSYIRVGRFATSSARHLKSSKASWTPGDRVTAKGLLHLTE